MGKGKWWFTLMDNRLWVRVNGWYRGGYIKNKARVYVSSQVSGCMELSKAQIESINELQGRVVTLDYSTDVQFGREMGEILKEKYDIPVESQEIGASYFKSQKLDEVKNHPRIEDILVNGYAEDGWATVLKSEVSGPVSPVSVMESMGDRIVESFNSINPMCVPGGVQFTPEFVITKISQGIFGHYAQDSIINDVNVMERADISEESKGIDGYMWNLKFDVKKNDKSQKRAWDSGMLQKSTELLVSFAPTDEKGEIRIGIEPNNEQSSSTPSHSIARNTRVGKDPITAAEW